MFKDSSILLNKHTLSAFWSDFSVWSVDYLQQHCGGGRGAWENARSLGPAPQLQKQTVHRAKAGILRPRGHLHLQHVPALHFRFIPIPGRDIFISKSKAQRSPAGGSRHVVVSIKAGTLLEAFDSKYRALALCPPQRLRTHGHDAPLRTDTQPDRACSRNPHGPYFPGEETETLLFSLPSRQACSAIKAGARTHTTSDSKFCAKRCRGLNGE